MKTLLVLEGESSIIKVLRDAVKEFRLIEARTAEEALSLFICLDRQIDVLVAHLVLPMISGIQVGLILRLELPNLPIILMSSLPVSDWTERDCADLERLGSRSVTI